ncbi:DUF7352 domain-containing protein [Paenibacillus sp. S-38]|uniref:DUF7352 domain-containing protein n=1 Tax=Paenibacillus sp. S-38 TaxID=3416710 RepID=UPI003CF16ABD
MRTIYKYPIELQNKQLLELPKGSRVLSAQEQYGGINIYALVDTDLKETEKIVILLYGTGHRITEDIEEYRFLDTVSMHGGNLVIHVFTEQL